MKTAVFLLGIVGILMLLNHINNPESYVQRSVDCREVKESTLCSISGSRYVSVMKDRTDGNLDQMFSCDCKTGKVVNFDEP